jgi:hypothetical protein
MQRQEGTTEANSACVAPYSAFFLRVGDAACCPASAAAAGATGEEGEPL